MPKKKKNNNKLIRNFVILQVILITVSLCFSWGDIGKFIAIYIGEVAVVAALIMLILYLSNSNRKSGSKAARKRPSSSRLSPTPKSSKHGESLAKEPFGYNSSSSSASKKSRTLDKRNFNWGIDDVQRNPKVVEEAAKQTHITIREETEEKKPYIYRSPFDPIEPPKKPKVEPPKAVFPIFRLESVTPVEPDAETKSLVHEQSVEAPDTKESEIVSMEIPSLEANQQDAYSDLNVSSVENFAMSPEGSAIGESIEDEHQLSSAVSVDNMPQPHANTDAAVETLYMEECAVSAEEPSDGSVESFESCGYKELGSSSVRLVVRPKLAKSPLKPKVKVVLHPISGQRDNIMDTEPADSALSPAYSPLNPQAEPTKDMEHVNEPLTQHNDRIEYTTPIPIQADPVTEPVVQPPFEVPEKPKAQQVYSYPELDLLKKPEPPGEDEHPEIDAEFNANKLIDTLASFGVGARVLEISMGPSVTRFEIQPNAGVKVSKIVNLADDIALNLAATGVRIEAPIPGKAAIGIEVPNKEVSPVLLRDVIEAPEFQRHPSKLAFAVGKDVSGKTVVGDIARMPHMLIAGATGSGKSVCINTLIASILYKASPSEVKMLMIDPKVVELGIYNGIPHLLIPVVTDPKKAAGALNWAVQEMTTRYKLFADNNVRDLKGFNALMAERGEDLQLPQIVIIIDELADLMMVAPNDVEDCICRLAQMARAAGMHLVIATQRPSVDVITGVIKANIPSRVSFAVSSQIDSRTILDMAGAEKLLGRGDMLFNPIGEPKPIRVQGGFISDKEVESIVAHIKSSMTAEYDSEIIEKIESQSEPQPPDNSNGGNNPNGDDDLLPQAIRMVIEYGQASASLIQRKFKVGYARAARILDQMEQWGVVSAADGSKPRQILLTMNEWDELNS